MRHGISSLCVLILFYHVRSTISFALSASPFSDRSEASLQGRRQLPCARFLPNHVRFASAIRSESGDGWSQAGAENTSAGSSFSISRPSSLMATSLRAMTALIVTASSMRCPVPCPGYSTLQASLGMRCRNHRSARSPKTPRVMRGWPPHPATAPGLEDSVSQLPGRLGACESAPQASAVRPSFAVPTGSRRPVLAAGFRGVGSQRSHRNRCGRAIDLAGTGLQDQWPSERGRERAAPAARWRISADQFLLLAGHLDRHAPVAGPKTR